MSLAHALTVVTSWLKLSCAIEGAVSPAIHINATANLVPISRAFAPLFQHAACSSLLGA